MSYGKKRLKYNNTRFINGDGRWDSIKEYKRYLLLLERVKTGQIKFLQRQVKFLLIPTYYKTEIIQLKTKTKEKKVALEKECSYYADFTYLENDRLVVEDVKSEITRKNADFVIKRKLMLYVHNILIKEV